MAFLPSLIQAFKELLTAPFRGNSFLWWQLLPVLLLWIVLEFYFNTHKHEKLGWNTALSNGISLFWISVASIQPLFRRELGEAFSTTRFIMLLLILCYAVCIAVISFRHLFGPRVTYWMAYPTVIYYLAVLAVFWGYKVLDVNWWILLAALLFWGVVFGLRTLLFYVLPESSTDVSGDNEDF